MKWPLKLRIVKFLIAHVLDAVKDIHKPMGRPSHDYSRSTNKAEVSAVWKRECEIQVVVYQHRRMGGQDSWSPDGEDF